MNKKIRWITETAVMLALLLTFQWLGGNIPGQMTKQIVTGSLVNCVLAVSVLYVGYTSGIAISLISPIFAYMLGINGVAAAILPIMAGNTCFVVLLRLICGKTGKPFWRQIVAWITAACVKFGVMYSLVAWVMCGLMGPVLNFDGKTTKQLFAMSGINQLFAALIGGALALSILPVLRKALKK